MRSTFLTGLLVMTLSAASIFAEEPPGMKPPGPGPIKPPVTTIPQQPSGVAPMAPSYHAPPAYDSATKSMAPPEPPGDMATERARQAKAKRRMAEEIERARQAEAKRRMGEEMFRVPKVALDRTTEITQGKDGDFSGRALFSVQDRPVAIICTSTVRAATVAFWDSINSIFAGNRSADLSLEKIVERAREDFRKQPGLSGAEIKVQYIDRFGEAHVVQISRGQSTAMLASR